MHEVEIEQVAQATQAGAEVIDVREVHEYVGGHVPGAVCMPMGQVPQRTGEIHRDGPVYVLCATGKRSAAVTDFLRQQGYDAFNVVGGTAAWIRAGRDVEQGAPSGRS